VTVTYPVGDSVDVVVANPLGGGASPIVQCLPAESAVCRVCLLFAAGRFAVCLRVCAAWERPLIYLQFKNTQITSRRAGIYIQVPIGSNLGQISVTIVGGVVAAPFFRADSVGTTSTSQWENSGVVPSAHGRDAAAPWADFETNHFLMQVRGSQMSPRLSTPHAEVVCLTCSSLSFAT
jgi:hypothetical protein